MANPQQSGDGAFGFFDDHNDVSIASQADWLSEFTLSRAVDLGFDRLNSHDLFDPQNHNVDVALHAIDNSGQFANQFLSSQDDLDILAPGSSIEQAPILHTGFTDVTQSQEYQATQARQVCKPNVASEFSIELSNGFHAVQNFQTPPLSLVNQSLRSVQDALHLQPVQSANNESEWDSKGNYGRSTNSSKRASCDEVQLGPVPCVDRLLSVEASEKSNAVGFIQDWRTRYPDIYPLEKEINALSDLCRLPQPVVQTLLNQMLLSRKPEATVTLQEQHPIKRAKINPPLHLRDQKTEPISDQVFFEQAILSVRDRAPKCRPVLDSAILRRDHTKIYQCTLLCGRKFPKKGEWKRHEELNYPQEGWICSLSATALVMGISTCVYCGTPDPETDHIHRYHANSKPCRPKPLNAPGRIFKRKHRFFEHLKNEHGGVPPPEYMVRNRLPINSKFPSQCGFCPRYGFQNWDDRIQHLGDHFENGKDMSSWNRSSADDFTDGKDDTEDGNLPGSSSPDRSDDEGDSTPKGSSSGSGRLTDLSGSNSFPLDFNALSVALPHDKNDFVTALEGPRQLLTSVNHVTTGPQNDAKTGPIKRSTIKLHDSKPSVQETNERNQRLVGLMQDPTEAVVPARVKKTILKAVQKQKSNHNESAKVQSRDQKIHPQDFERFFEWEKELSAMSQQINNRPTEKRQTLSEQEFQLGTKATNRDLLKKCGVQNSTFPSETSVSSDQDATSRMSGIVDFVVNLSGGYIYSPNMFSKNGTVFCAPYRKILPEKLSPFKDPRSGPLSQEQSMTPSAVRQVKSCSACYAAHAKCSGGSLCQRCQKMSSSPFARPLCFRGSLKDYSEVFFPGVLSSWLNEEETDRLIKEYSHEAPSAIAAVEFTCGPRYPPTKLQVNTFRPNTYGLFDSHQLDDDLKQKGNGARQLSTSTCVLGTYLPDLKHACMKFIKSMVSSTAYAADLSSKEASDFRRDVIEAVYTLTLANKNQLIQNAMMLHAMHYFMTHNLTINPIPTTKLAEDSLESERTRTSVISSRLLNRQIKHAMHILMRELTEEVLKTLDRELRSRGESTWAVCFCVYLILCMCMEEIAAENMMAPAYDDAHQVKLKFMESHLESGGDFFQHMTVLFHSRFKTRGNNPLSDEVFPSTQGPWNDQEILFITRIRKVIADYNIAQYDLLSKPSRSGEPVVIIQDAFPASPKGPSGRLMLSFIRSFLSQKKDPVVV